MDFQFSQVGAPYEHQRRLFEARKEEFKWAHFWEMGTGKSWMLLHEIQYAYVKGEIDTAVIMAKKGEYLNWEMFLIPALLPPHIPREVLTFKSAEAAGAKYRDKVKSMLRVDTGRLRIVVVNCESLQGKGGDLLIDLYNSSKLGVFLGCDESTWAKEFNSKRSKEAYAWAYHSKIKRIMSGTPVTQSPLDLWGQSQLLGQGILGYRSYYSFRNTFEVQKPITMSGGRKLMVHDYYHNLDMLNGILSSFSDQVYKKDCLDLPDKIYKKHVVELTPEQQKLYDTLKTEAMAEVQGHQVEVTTVLALITKLHQVACGQLKVDEDTYVSIPNNGIDALSDILEGFDGKAIIWATYRRTLEDVVAALRQKFGAAAVVDFYGGTSGPDREYAIRAFQDRGSPVRFFVANPQSAGYGTTLTAATLVVYYSNGYNLEHRLQSEDRAHRIGQTEPVTYIDLVRPNTVDERILEVLRNKKSLAHEVLGSDISSWI